MPVYRKKTVEIQAVILEWGTWNEVCDFVPEQFFGGGVYLDDDTKQIVDENTITNTIGLYINTLEGKMLVSQGDYIIQGVNGEFYPCKPDIFDKTYDFVRE